MKNLSYVFLLLAAFGVIFLVTQSNQMVSAERGAAVQMAFVDSQGVDEPEAQVLDCYADLENLASSSTYQSSDWEISFITPSEEHIGAQDVPLTPNPFFDLNGDGLVDYVIKDQLSDDVTGMCVYLNNGSGFDPAYRCAYDGGAGLYYGDCAG